MQQTCVRLNDNFYRKTRIVHKARVILATADLTYVYNHAAVQRYNERAYSDRSCVEQKNDLAVAATSSFAERDTSADGKKTCSSGSGAKWPPIQTQLVVTVTVHVWQPVNLAVEHSFGR